MNTAILTPPEPDHLLTCPSPSWTNQVLPGGGQVSTATSDGTVEIHLAGEIDVYDRLALADVLTASALQSHAPVVLVVAHDVTFVDLRILLLVAQVRSGLRRDGRDLIVTGLRGVHATAWAYVTTNA